MSAQVDYNFLIRSAMYQAWLEGALEYVPAWYKKSFLESLKKEMETHPLPAGCEWTKPNEHNMELTEETHEN